MTTPAYSAELLERLRRRRGRLAVFERLQPARTALLVVDLQVAFMAPGSPSEVPAARSIVPAVNRLGAALRAAGGQVVFVVSTYGPDAADRWPILFDHVFSSEAGRAFRDGLTRGSPGHALWPELEREAADPVVEKNRFSGFIGSRGRLEALLRERGLDTVLIAGTVTNVCCESTAREAAMLDFKTVMVSDANAGRSAEQDLETYSTFLAAFGDVRSTAEVIAMLG